MNNPKEVKNTTPSDRKSIKRWICVHICIYIESCVKYEQVLSTHCSGTQHLGFLWGGNGDEVTSDDGRGHDFLCHRVFGWLHGNKKWYELILLKILKQLPDFLPQSKQTHKAWEWIASEWPHRAQEKQDRLFSAVSWVLVVKLLLCSTDQLGCASLSNSEVVTTSQRGLTSCGSTTWLPQITGVACTHKQSWSRL